MELKLTRPLLFFDIESTGLNIATDGIIELSFVKVLPEGGEPLVKTWKIKPWDYRNHRVIPINPSASEVNGVKDEDLVNCPKFIEVLPEVAEWLEGSDLAGFNSTKFDLPLLAEEIERVREYCNTRMADPKAREKASEMLARIDKIACDYAGDELTIGFKSTFLTEILSNMGCNGVVIKFADARRAALILPAEEEAESEKICGILMPIMIS